MSLRISQASQQLDVCSDYANSMKWVDGKGYVMVRLSLFPKINTTASGHGRFCFQWYEHDCETKDCSDWVGKASCKAGEEGQMDCYNYIDQCELLEASSPAKFRKYVEVDAPQHARVLV